MKFTIFLLQIGGILLVNAFTTFGFGVRLNQVKGCPGVTFTFPRHLQKTDYVRYRSYVPAMKEATVCAWIQTRVDFNNLESILSYATKSKHNALLLALTKGKKLGLWVANRQIKRFPTYLRTGISKSHMCIGFTSKFNLAYLYINGRRKWTQYVKIYGMEGGGDLILGQEQDAANAGRLDATQAFRGSITNLMIWPRLLTASEIGKIAHSCDCPRDYSIAMTMDKSELHGNVGYYLSSSCPTV